VTEKQLIQKQVDVIAGDGFRRERRWASRCG
jgi:hypothetical protein